MVGKFHGGVHSFQMMQKGSRSVKVFPSGCDCLPLHNNSQTHETPSSSTLPPARVPPPPKTKEKRPAHPDRSFRYYPCFQPLTAFSCSCTYSVVRIFFTVPSTSSSVVLWLV